MKYSVIDQFYWATAGGKEIVSSSSRNTYMFSLGIEPWEGQHSDPLHSPT